MSSENREIYSVATAPTVYGIETSQAFWDGANSGVATAPTVYGIETMNMIAYAIFNIELQQHLPFTVCAEGCETAEERSDDEVRTSQVPERSEGKTKEIKQQHLSFTVLKRTVNASII